MTEAEKKEIYDKEYSRWLEWHKNKFINYEPYLKIPLKERWEILEHFKSIFAIMKKCGVCRFDGEEPMSNVSDFLVKFKKKGDPDSLDDLLISNHESCWTTVMFERTPEEIEAAAKSSAQMEVDMAEWREKKAAEEAEEQRKEEEEWKARQKEEEERRAKCKKDMDEWQSRENSKKAELEAWYDGVRSELDKMRTGHYSWSIHDHLDTEKIAKIRKYVWTLFAFTDAQNMSLTGYGLYAQNEERAKAHEDMLDYLELYDNKYAIHVTKSYDFSDDYDSRTDQYKHLDEDVVVDMLGFALVKAREITSKLENAMAAVNNAPKF